MAKPMRSTLSLSVLSVVAFVLALLLCSGSPAEAHPKSASISGVTLLGSGCPRASPKYSLSKNKKKVTIEFTSLLQVRVPAAHLVDRQKACTMSVALSYPSGWRYTASKFTVGGVVRLAAKQTARFSLVSYYQGGARACNYVQNFDGGARGLKRRGFVARNACARASPSVCGTVRGLVVLMRVSINNQRNPKGSGTIKATNALSFSLAWSKCRRRT